MEAICSLSALKGVDVRTVAPDTLMDVREVEIDSDLPKRERMLDYIRQIGNPYCFKCRDVVVKVGYTSTDVTLDDRMESYLRTL